MIQKDHTSNSREHDLDYVLEESKTYAKRGYKQSQDTLRLLKTTVKEVTNSLQKNIDTLTKSNIHNSETSDMLTKQLTAINSDFKSLPNELEHDIEKLSTNSFSITLFGRTNAGKSTLMEILTKGNGNSIGKGQQRTTLDVRTYKYKNMLITDVPGTGAFDDDHVLDERIAVEAAKQSDLILFLITNDGPQASEAEFMSEMVSLGKPIICILNVKVDLGKGTIPKIFFRDINKGMDYNTLNDIRLQFIEFGLKYGQDWSKIKFVYTHLLSAFRAIHEENDELKRQFYQKSRFQYLEEYIVDEIKKNGKFYKLKSFTDTLVVPINNRIEVLFNQSILNSQQGRRLIRKRRELSNWTDKFTKESTKRVEALINKIHSDLKNEIAHFAEDNYDNENAGKKWKEIVDSYEINHKINLLFKQLSKEVESELKEIRREIDSELKLSFEDFQDKSIKGFKPFNTRKALGWSTTLSLGVLAIAGLFVFTNPVLLIGSVAVGILGGIFAFLTGDPEKKKLDARRRLEKDIESSLVKQLKHVKKNTLDSIHKEIINKQLKVTTSEIDKIVDSLFTLSGQQQKFTVSLNKKLREVNFELISNALEFLGFEGAESKIYYIGRIPNHSMVIILHDREQFPNDARYSLSKLLSENIWFTYHSGNPKFMLKRLLGNSISFSIEEINEDMSIVHINPKNRITTETQNRILLAQQISEMLIMR